MKVIIKADLKLEGFVDNDAQIFYKGDVIGESSVLFADQIGPVVRHNYLLSNNGPGKVSNASVRIRWPYEVMSNYPQVRGRILAHRKLCSVWQFLKNLKI